MRANEMTPEQQEAAVARAQNADAILADFERQHGFELPGPWRGCIEVLLLGGLGDPELHRIFDAYAQVEHEAGRMEARKPSYEW